MKKIRPVQLFLIFVGFILLARLFENKVQVLYYLLVAIGFVFCFLAIKKQFRR